MPDLSDLRQRQALPLNAKVLMSQNRIREWYDRFNGDVYVAFSGGKDSTVLAHIVHDIYPDVPLVFANTGLEYPEIQAFARKKMAEFVRPKMMFSEVISKYGYPIISKEIAECIYYSRMIKNRNGGQSDWEQYKAGKRRRMVGSSVAKMFNHKMYLPLCNETQFAIGSSCCDVMKKWPVKQYQKKTNRVPIIGTLAEESLSRMTAWLKHGCNSFDGERKSSQPMSFWTEQDVLLYIKQERIEIASVYGEIVTEDSDGMQYDPIPGITCKLKCSGCERTGCIFCGFGVHREKGETRFQRLARTHPRQYEYCLEGGQWVENPSYDPTAPKMDGEWINWNPKKIWVPSKHGLGMKKVFDDVNQIYGKDFIRYE